MPLYLSTFREQDGVFNVRNYYVMEQLLRFC